MTVHPIDAVIPLGPNDQGLVAFTARSTRRFVEGVRSIWVVSRDDPGLPDVIHVPESRFPFRIEEVREILGVDRRAGWYLQQLLKLYLPQAVPECLDRYLVVDADTIFLRHCRFIDDGRPVFNFGTEYHAPYFEHMARLHPGLRKMFAYSGVTHCMLFDRHWVGQMMAAIEAQHPGKPFWRLFLEAVDPAEREKSGASEYELYLNFCLQTHPGDLVIRRLDWANASDVDGVRPDLHDYVSLHWYGRRAGLDRDALARKVFGPG